MNCHYAVGAADIQGSRENQEDSYIVTDPAGSNRPFSDLDQILVAVADGVGGEAAGEIASQTTVQAFSQSVQQRHAADTWPVILFNALQHANEAIRETIKANPDTAGMASTLVAATLDKDRLYWISVGDSHLYHLRDGEIKKLNADHSLGAIVDRQANAGFITTDVAAMTPYRNMLISCVMGEELTEIDLSHDALPLRCGDRLILASDGLNTLDNGKIATISHNNPDPQGCAEALTTAVTKATLPNQDNTMVVVIDLTTSNPEKITPAPAKPRLFRFIIISIIVLILAGSGLTLLLRSETGQKPVVTPRSDETAGRFEKNTENKKTGKTTTDDPSNK